jgi:hypothetical protein
MCLSGIGTVHSTYHRGCGRRSKGICGHNRNRRAEEQAAGHPLHSDGQLFEEVAPFHQEQPLFSVPLVNAEAQRRFAHSRNGADQGSRGANNSGWLDFGKAPFGVGNSRLAYRCRVRDGCCHRGLIPRA